MPTREEIKCPFCNKVLDVGSDEWVQVEVVGESEELAVKPILEATR